MAAISHRMGPSIIDQHLFLKLTRERGKSWVREIKRPDKQINLPRILLAKKLDFFRKNLKMMLILWLKSFKLGCHSLVKNIKTFSALNQINWLQVIAVITASVLRLPKFEAKIWAVEMVQVLGSNPIDQLYRFFNCSRFNLLFF